MATLSITESNYRGHRSYKLVGNLNLRSRSELTASIESHWKQHHNLLLDLSEVEEIDLAGLSWLMLADNFMRRCGGRLRILAASRSVQQAMRLLNPATRVLLRHEGNPLPYRILKPDVRIVREREHGPSA